MFIRPFDFTDADYAALVRVNEAAWPGQPDSESYWRRQDACRDPKLLFRRVMAGVRGRVVGYASFGHNPYTFHPRRFLLDIRVDAGYQGQGVGAALYDHLLEALTEHDPIALEAMTREDLPRAARFLDDRGFAVRERVARSELDAGRFDAEAFEPVAERLAARGIKIRAWSELRAEPDAEGKLYRLMELILRDLPWQDEYVAQPFDTFIQSYRDNPDFLPEALVVAVGADRRWLGLSQIWASQASDDTFYTGLTGVRREARRRGLATALKAASISSLPPAPPSARGPFVRTQNEDSNPMLALNLRLGFEPRPAELFYFKAIEP